ncbi:MAG: class I SAM-dependent methyltransferase [Sulfuricaulis sp.]|uniref:class I SAM-dependent methyltransferase n=1 Tax=Sulfuricaulis sp. TaxID=2003553 RepID=UPI0034A4084C
MLCYPYPSTDEEQFASGTGRADVSNSANIHRGKLAWHLRSGARNHHNFTSMAEFVLTDADRQRRLNVLDYGGGGGQFALVLKSLYPLATPYIVDINDAKLLDEFRPLNTQIRFADFEEDATKFDVIFMNDVFEHVSNPLGVLRLLRTKLTCGDGRVFIDTPRQFWIYPATELLWNRLHEKLLRGTVDFDHQQIWSRRSFLHVVRAAGFGIQKYVETSEFTQPPEFYLDNMKISNRAVRVSGKLLYAVGRSIAKNKILAVLKPTASQA